MENLPNEAGEPRDELLKLKISSCANFTQFYVKFKLWMEKVYKAEETPPEHREIVFSKQAQKALLLAGIDQPSYNEAVSHIKLNKLPFDKALVILKNWNEVLIKESRRQPESKVFHTAAGRRVEKRPSYHRDRQRTQPPYHRDRQNSPHNRVRFDKSSEACNNFIRGDCRRGEKCRYTHYSQREKKKRTPGPCWTCGGPHLRINCPKPERRSSLPIDNISKEDAQCD